MALLPTIVVGLRCSTPGLIALALAGLSPASLGVNSYHLQSLGTLGGPSSFPYSINSAGQVVGSTQLPDGAYHAFIWNPNQGMQDIAPLATDTAGFSLAITDKGAALAYSSYAVGDMYPTRPFVWDAVSGAAPVGDSTLWLTSMNNAGVAVGHLAPDAPGRPAAVICDPGSGLHPLTSPGLVVLDGLKINNAGQILIQAGVSEGQVLAGASEGYLRQPDGSALRVSGPGDAFGTAFDLNDRGAVVGYALANDPTGGPDHAFIWDPVDGATDITPGTGIYSCAWAINNGGQVIGWEELNNGPRIPFLYQDGQTYDLTTLLDNSAAGWTNLTLQDINDAGQIVGYGTYGGQTQAFLLDPLTNTAPDTAPEPATLGILAAGGLGLLRRRR